MVLGGEVWNLPSDPYGFGGGAGGLGASSEETEGFEVDAAISGGSGGIGGGIDVGCGVLTGALRCCLEMTGGSLANTSRKMAKKSRIFDFCGKALAPLIIKATSKTSEGK
jgi:hypothetical protein